MARKQKMKVYHGIPKSVTDEHTIFYADFDGNGIPAIGNIDNPSNISAYKQSPTGYCPTSGGNIVCTTTKSTDVFTIDMFVPKFPKVTNGNKGIITLKNSVGKDLVHIQVPSQQDYLALVTVSNGGWQRLTNSQEDCFVRLVVNKGKITTYINGIKNDNYPTINMPNFNKIRMELHPSLWQGVCDLHVSDIDRGDYFPNLPQDFIEGKAIIKPRMGQQQIKGDPMYSQVANVKIPAFSDATSKLYCLSADKRKGYLKGNPEVFDVTSADTWVRGSSFKIKGLNGEVVSGVIDTDTALTTVVNVLSSSKYVLNSVKGLAAGDVIRFYIGTSSSPECTIKEIDASANIITLNAALSGWEAVPGYCVIETTTSTSSPTVKKSDGTTVVGTWSGLGTNEATFTLGDNSSIEGKDLYVEYSLTIPHGNSDFPKLPHAIERVWGENGIEMNPVDYLVITDDFKFKTKGNNTECSHYCSFLAATSLVSPSTFAADSYMDYQKIYENDSNIMSLSNNSVSGNKGQLLLGFNLIDIVEKKMGNSIPGADKVQWLKDNLVECGCTCHCGGSSPSGHKIYLTNYCHSENRWYTDNKTHTSSTLAMLQYNQMNSQNDWIKKSLSPTGYVYFLLFTDATDATTACNIRISYATISIRLKTEPNYMVFYCKNTRAREDKCNPVLVQKETKTIKRYLPSKECFATESLYANPTTSNVTAEVLSSYLAKEETYLTTLGSGAYLVHNNIRFKNCINKLGLGIKAYQYANKPLGKTTVGAYTDLYTIRTLSQPYPTDNLMYPPQSIPNIPCVLMTPYLLNSGSELSLGLLVLELNASGARTAAYTKAYTLPNRPLIK